MLFREETMLTIFDFQFFYRKFLDGPALPDSWSWMVWEWGMRNAHGMRIIFVFSYRKFFEKATIWECPEDQFWTFLLSWGLLRGLLRPQLVPKGLLG